MDIRLSQESGGKKYVPIRFVPGTQTELLRVGDQSELHIGIGEAKRLDTRGVSLVIRRMIQEAKARSFERIELVLAEVEKIQKGMQPRQIAELMATHALLAEYVFDIYKTQAKEKRRIKELLIRGPRLLQGSIDRGVIIASEANAARSLANTPGGTMTPTVLAQAAKDAAQGTAVRVTVYDKARIEKLKMGALLGVAQGSTEEPRFIIMEYQGASKKESSVVLVGKGVTFDSGGINLKPTGALDDMHMDMSGAAVVIHSIVTAAKLKARKNLVALIPAAENMVSGSSYRPGDILRSMSGTTVEVTNTDAEGRLLLADALAYAKRLKPKAVIDVATLTGAAMVALGQRANAVFSENAKLVRVAFEASETTGESIWQLPLWDAYAADNKATFGDIANSSKTRYGGAITGAMFLKHFAQGYPWMHIDMAPRMVSIEGDFLAKGSSGEPMRLLVQMLQKL